MAKILQFKNKSQMVLPDDPPDNPMRGYVDPPPQVEMPMTIEEAFALLVDNRALTLLEQLDKTYPAGSEQRPQAERELSVYTLGMREAYEIFKPFLIQMETIRQKVGSVA
jgi:hypothetical protein